MSGSWIPVVQTVSTSKKQDLSNHKMQKEIVGIFLTDIKFNVLIFCGGDSWKSHK